jgi:hypothetical protein
MHAVVTHQEVNPQVIQVMEVPVEPIKQFLLRAPAESLLFGMQILFPQLQPQLAALPLQSQVATEFIDLLDLGA